MTLSKPSGKKRSRAFTLAEVLIAGAILAVLVALILGAFNQAVAYSRATACISNLRALGVGFAAYISDNNGFYPDGDRQGYWPHHIAKYVDRKKFFCPVALEWEKGDVSFIRDAKKLDDKAWANVVTRISYGYNSGGLAPDIGHRWATPNTDPRFIKPHTINRTVILLVDAGILYADRKRGWGHYVAAPEVSNHSMPLPRHFNKANFLWTDGHIDQRYCDLNAEKDTYKYTRFMDWEPRDEKVPARHRQ